MKRPNILLPSIRLKILQNHFLNEQPGFPSSPGRRIMPRNLDFPTHGQQLPLLQHELDNASNDP